MRQILAISLAALCLSTASASAFDLQKLSDKLFECDGVGIELATKLTDDTSSGSESRGYAVLGMVEMLISPDGEKDGSLTGFAREHIGAVKAKASDRLAKITAECDVAPDAATTVDNPFN